MVLFLAQDEPPPKPWENRSDPKAAWEEIITGGVEVYFVPGKHLTMFKSPHVSVMADILSDCLKRINDVSLALAITAFFQTSEFFIPLL